MMARVQGFPDSWTFGKRKTTACRMIGNAFPPPVAEAVGSQIIKVLKENGDYNWKGKEGISQGARFPRDIDCRRERNAEQRRQGITRVGEVCDRHRWNAVGRNADKSRRPDFRRAIRGSECDVPPPHVPADGRIASWRLAHREARKQKCTEDIFFPAIWASALSWRADQERQETRINARQRLYDSPRHSGIQDSGNRRGDKCSCLSGKWQRRERSGHQEKIQRLAYPARVRIGQMDHEKRQGAE